MTTKVETGMVEDGFATTAALAALRSIFVGTYHDLAYEPDAEAEPWFLPCYGQTVLVADYPALFAKLGTTYGGNGTTTFGIPDHNGRVRAGKDNMGGASKNRLTGLSGGVNGDVLGAVGGLETHTLTEAQLAAHDHDITVNNSSGTTPIPIDTQAGGAFDAGSPFALGKFGGTPGVNDQAATLPAHNHTASASNAGGGQAHNNVQPTIISVVCILAY
jgi:microcystin-dependent protein